MLLEHYAGAFPAWLAPVQVLGVPVADEFAPHLAGFVKSLEDEMVRCEITIHDRFGKKIRNASKSKVPFILIVGEEDMNNNAVASASATAASSTAWCRWTLLASRFSPSSRSASR